MAGVIEGNYGGVIDKVNVSLFKAFKRYFWVDLQIHWSKEFDSSWRAAQWGKFEIVGYTPSPL